MHAALAAMIRRMEAGELAPAEAHLAELVHATPA
jgi:hypothetical protein